MQRIIVLCVLFVRVSTMNACNICSCTSMGNSLGILPGFRSHFIGIRETYRSYNSHHPASILSPEGSSSSETYHNTEFWGRWYPIRRLQVFAFVPVNSYQRIENNSNKTISGLGDISVLINYMLLNTGDSSGKAVKQALLIGGGLKIKSGKYNPEEYAAFQLGSGSNDLLFNVSYTLRYRNAGIMTDGYYRINGMNTSAYQFGNKASTGLKAFYWLRAKRISFLPYTGTSLETNTADRLKGKYQDYTAGYAMYGNIGADMYRGKFQLGFNAQLPIKQSLGQGQIIEHPRLQVNLVYHITSK